MKPSATPVIGAIAVIATMSMFAVVSCHASRSAIDAGFWFDEGSFALSVDDAAKLGGPLLAQEMATIRQLSRAEVERALAGLRINLTEHQNAFWRVSVVGSGFF